MSGLVRVLPSALVDQIAAGEVVERPASAVKELVENALDAGARRVTIEVEGGGVTRISVLDDGSGMGPEDAALALERHATSKIASFEDLTRVATMGFRGEALPSIASVSRLVLTTAPDGSGLGTEVVADRGASPTSRPAPHAKGTRVVVEDLFGSVPARRKFLKSAEGELRAVVRTVTTLALANPSVAFTLRAGPRLLLDLPAAPSASARFREVLGDAVRIEPLAVDFAHTGMTLTGAITPAAVTFASRVNQWFFVNGRAVKDASVAHAVSLASREVLRVDRHPAFVLFLACPPSACDVNVHPQKLEVRFRDPAAVHALVHRGLVAALTGAKGAVPVESDALADGRGGPGIFLEGKRGGGQPEWLRERATLYGAGAPGGAATAALLDATAGGLSPSSYSEEKSSVSPFSSNVADSPLGQLRLLGQYRDSFLVAESEEGLVLVDQHVAHERVRYERFLTRLESAVPPAQGLLTPLTFEARPEEAELLGRSDSLLAAAGFVVSELSGRTFLVTAAPADMPASTVVPALRDFLDRLLALPDGSGASPALEREVLAASLACHGAITVHHRLAPAEAARLLADLAACRDPWTCPHGRPILLSVAHGEVERRFGRRP